MTSIFLSSGEDMEDICGKEELVTFNDVSCLYPPDQRLTVKYQLGSRVTTSASDWIGIFAYYWEDLSQPLSRITLPDAADRGQGGQGKARRKSVTFSAATLRNLDDDKKSYQFVYVDAHQHVLGVSLPFKVAKSKVNDDKVEQDGNMDFGSESPVLLSSASEDEGEWELANQSSTNTMRQAAPPAGAQGGSSTSDLSDIVVLSSSPSQEAARNHQGEQLLLEEMEEVLPDISWNSDSEQSVDGGALRLENLEDDVDGEISKDNLTLAATGGNEGDRAGYGGGHGRSCVTKRLDPSTGETEYSDESCEFVPVDADVHFTATIGGPERHYVAQTPSAEVEKQKTPGILRAWDAASASSLLSQLKIVELDTSSEDEDKGKRAEKGIEVKRNKAFAAVEGATPKLITEIQEDVTNKNPPFRSMQEKPKAKNPGKSDANQTMKKSEGIEKCSKNNLKQPFSLPADTAVNTIKKCKKKRRKVKLRDEAQKRYIDSDDDDDDVHIRGNSDNERSSQYHRTKRNSCAKSIKGQDKELAQSNTPCPDIERSTVEACLSQGLVFDELSDFDIRTQREKLKQERRKERKSARSRGAAKPGGVSCNGGGGATDGGCWGAYLWDVVAEGELYHGSRPKEVSSEQVKVDMNITDEEASIIPFEVSELKEKISLPVKDKRDVKKKQKSSQDKLMSGIKSSENDMDGQNQLESISGKYVDDVTSNHVSRKGLESINTPESPRGFPGAEMRELKLKYQQGQKSKATRKKSKRRSSSRRRQQCGCEVQYLFSMDLKPSILTTEKSDTPSIYDDIDASNMPATSMFVEDAHNASTEEFPSLTSSTSISKHGLLDSQKGILATHGKDIELHCTEKKQDGQEKDANKENGEVAEEEEVEEDVVEKALTFAYRGRSPHRVGGKAGSVPYVPPYVLDLMDALPPASVSPDGRAMVEWRRSLLPLVPKHALPVFHSKYKAKFARRHELRRLKLRRGVLNRQSGYTGHSGYCGIIDKIRHQLSLSDTLSYKLTRKSPTVLEPPVIPTHPSEQKGFESLPSATNPLSYASVVKKTHDTTAERSPSCGAEGASTCPKSDDHVTLGVFPDLVPVEAGAAGQVCAVSKNAGEVSPLPTTSAGISLRPTEGARREMKKASRIAANFPKEFTHYTSSGNGVATGKEPQIPGRTALQVDNAVNVHKSQVQLFTQKCYTDDNGNEIKDTEEHILSWPKPKFIKETLPCQKFIQVTPATGVVTELIPVARGQVDTPSLHIRSAAARTKLNVQTLSPVRPHRAELVSDQTESTTVQMSTDQEAEDDQRVLLDLALTSCLADNAELRNVVVSLERQLQKLKLEQQPSQGQLVVEEHNQPPLPQQPPQQQQMAEEQPRMEESKEQGKSPGDDSNGQVRRVPSLSPTRTLREITKSPEERRVPVSKWAGKVSKLVRSNVEIISLSAKIKDHEKEIASLTNQVNTLKEALQAETKRSTRALTKWFKLKLKVKVLRSRIQELEQEEGASPFTVVKGSKAPEVTTGQDPGRPVQIKIEDVPDNMEEAVADMEPPCKRQKLDHGENSKACDKGFSTSPTDSFACPAPTYPCRQDCPLPLAPSHVFPMATPPASMAPPLPYSAPPLTCATPHPTCTELSSATVAPPLASVNTPHTSMVPPLASSSPPATAAMFRFSPTHGQCNPRATAPPDGVSGKAQHAVLFPRGHPTYGHDLQQQQQQQQQQQNLPHLQQQQIQLQLQHFNMCPGYLSMTHEPPQHDCPPAQQFTCHPPTPAQFLPAPSKVASTSGPTAVGVAPRRRVLGQRKRSPPHLPLPTPRHAPASPPHYNPALFVFPQSSPPQHIVYHTSPPHPHRPARSVGTLPPSTASPPQFLQLPWLLPSNSPPILDHSVLGQGHNGMVPATPWVQTAPALSSSWIPRSPDGAVSYQTPLSRELPHAIPHWVQRPGKTWSDSCEKFQPGLENTAQYHHHQQPQQQQHLLQQHQHTPTREQAHAGQQLYSGGHGTRRVQPSQLGSNTTRQPDTVEVQANYFQPPAAKTTSPPLQQASPSPPGRYRSDFMKQLMRREESKPWGEPNPYRLFHHSDAQSSRDLSQQQEQQQKQLATISPSFPSVAYYGCDPCQPTTKAVTSENLGQPGSTCLPQLVPVNSAEACYRNTTAFLEFTADGLVEATRRDVTLPSTPPQQVHVTRACDATSNNATNNCEVYDNDVIADLCGNNSVNQSFRLIESRKACQAMN